MKIQLTESFQRDVSVLSKEQQSQLFGVILKLPVVVKDPHLHLGLGLRKVHPSGVFEARIGLGLRIVFGYQEQTLVLHRVGTHDEIRRYLRSL